MEYNISTALIENRCIIMYFSQEQLAHIFSSPMKDYRCHAGLKFAFVTNIPQGVYIKSITFSLLKNAFAFLLMHDSFESVPAHKNIPEIVPKFKYVDPFTVFNKEEN